MGTVRTDSEAEVVRKVSTNRPGRPCRQRDTLPLEEIEAENKPFNPNYHEALEIESSTDHSEDTVTKVYQKGFKLEEHLVRTAKVKVSKPAPKKKDGADENGKCS